MSETSPSQEPESPRSGATGRRVGLSAIAIFFMIVFAVIRVLNSTDPPKNEPSVTLTVEQRDLMRHMKLDERLMGALVMLGDSIHQYASYDTSGQLLARPAIELRVPAGSGYKAVDRVGDAVASFGYRAWLSDNGFDMHPDQVAITRERDPYAPVILAGTSGANLGISNADVIARIREWDRLFGSRGLGAGADWAEMELVKQPADMKAFADEVSKFSPDVVTQGTETVDALAAEMKKTNHVYLWWD